MQHRRHLSLYWTSIAVFVGAACGPKPPWAAPVALSPPMKKLVVELAPGVELSGRGQEAALKEDHELRGRQWSHLATALRDNGFETSSDGRTQPHLRARLAVSLDNLGNERYGWRGTLTLTERNGAAVEKLEAQTEGGLGGVASRGARMLANLATRSRAVLIHAERVTPSSRSPLAVSLPDYPDGVSVLFLDLGADGGVGAPVAKVVSKILLTDLGDVDGVTALGVEELNAALDVERRRDLVGCQQVTCFAELGGALGTDFVVYGDVGRLGKSFVINLALVEIAQTRVRVRVAFALPADEDRLTAELPALTRELVDKLRASPPRPPSSTLSRAGS